MSRIANLKAGRLRHEMYASTIGREIIVLKETTSTNEVVRQMSAGDWPEGLVVFAEYQTAGRGQRGNKWESTAGKGLCFSVLLQPRLDLRDSTRLTEWAANAVAATIESYCSIEAVVKPPNDVYVGGRKVAGVLVEMRARPGVSHVAILGVGLNVNQAPSDFPEGLRERATSLAIIHRGLFDRHELAVDLLQNLDRTYREIFAPQ